MTSFGTSCLPEPKAAWVVWAVSLSVETTQLVIVSKEVRDWCDTEGIDHQLTAPYTSAHNGRAECLHRTLLGKARAMRMACNAPAFLWDEFCAMAAYLTMLTAATANNGKTPYELWFRNKPSLSHLREIGCRAFALHTPALSKVY